MSRPSPLISAPDLSAHLSEPDWCILDCRFALDDPGQGRRDYAEAHIPNALYAHLDDDLSGPVAAGRTGRHPLPAPASFGATLSQWGIDSKVNVVAYDHGDATIAARLWWMLRWVGHEKALVLDGGWAAWLAMGGAATGEPGRRRTRSCQVLPNRAMVATSAEVDEIRGRGDWLLIDSRTEERFRGESEPIDPVAGHIPGAVNAPFTGNLGSGGRLLPAAALKSRFSEILGETAPDRAVFYCGSGVTAAHQLLALAAAGVEGARLYAGSWSEWIADPRRPVAGPPR